MTPPTPPSLSSRTGPGLAAIVLDLRRRRIPNAISAFVLLSAVVVRLVDQGGGAGSQGVGRGGAGRRRALSPVAHGRDWRRRREARRRRPPPGCRCAPPLVRAARRPLAGGRGRRWSTTCWRAGRSPRRDPHQPDPDGAAAELPSVPSHRAKHLSVPYGLAIACGAAMALLVDAGRTSEREPAVEVTRSTGHFGRSARHSLDAFRQSCELAQ